MGRGVPCGSQRTYSGSTCRHRSRRFSAEVPGDRFRAGLRRCLPRGGIRCRSAGGVTRTERLLNRKESAAERADDRVSVAQRTSGAGAGNASHVAEALAADWSERQTVPWQSARPAAASATSWVTIATAAETRALSHTHRGRIADHECRPSVSPATWRSRQYKTQAHCPRRCTSPWIPVLNPPASPPALTKYCD
jgi:hypothetical protein